MANDNSMLDSIGALNAGEDYNGKTRLGRCSQSMAVGAALAQWWQHMQHSLDVVAQTALLVAVCMSHSMLVCTLHLLASCAAR